eukprot:8316551-Pyramimonas_sp.AAC.1
MDRQGQLLFQVVRALSDTTSASIVAPHFDRNLWLSPWLQMRRHCRDREADLIYRVPLGPPAGFGNSGHRDRFRHHGPRAASIVH